MKLLCHIILIFVFTNINGQDIAFRNISTMQGLSSNLVYDACQGPDGLLWIIANNNLDSYNEGKVTNYTNELIPNIEDYKWAEMEIDQSNIIWLRSVDRQLVYLDKNRKLNRIDLLEAMPEGILNFIKAETGRVELLSKEGHYYYNIEAKKLDTLHLFESPIYTFPALQISNEGNGMYVLSANHKAILYDGNIGSVTYVFDQVKCHGAAMINAKQMLVSTANHHELFLVNIEEDKIIENLALDISKDNPQINTYYRRIKHLDVDHIGVTSGHQGLFIINVHNFDIRNYAHDFANPSSISSDNSYFLYANDKGNVFVTSRTSGLNIFNINKKNARHIKSFADHKLNRIFEGHISHLARDQSGDFWLSSAQGLLKYDVSTNVSVINVRNEQRDNILSIISMFIDSYDRIWLGISGGGLEVVDKNGRLLKSIVSDDNDPNSLKSNYVYSMAMGIDDKLWIGTSKGINKVNLQKFQLEESMIKDSSQELNMAIREIKTIGQETFVGTWRNGCYVYLEKGLQKVNIPSGFEVENVTAFGKDEAGRLYMGSQNGLFLSNKGEGGSYEIETKLLEGRILSIDEDVTGCFWIATENILYKYDTRTHTIEEYTQENGFTGGGFRMHASFKDKDGLLYYGMNTGMCYFNPQELSRNAIELNPYITGIFEDHTKTLISGDEKIDLPAQENNIGVYYQNIDIWDTPELQYQYALSDNNEEWIPVITNPILIQNIKPGSYKIRVRASQDGEKWKKSANQIDLLIAYPWWRSWWFYAISLLTSLVVGYKSFGFYHRLKMDKLEEMKYDESLKFFSFSMHKYADIDKGFWDVILECIRQLDIDVSAIYLLDKEHKHLHRQAVKIDSDRHKDYLSNPVSVPLGEGKVGKAGQDRSPVIVNDLGADYPGTNNKFIRQSKICVPIISSNEILGVIDCEHHAKDYFNERRLSFISAISTIVATKMEAYNAEEERKEAEISLSKNLKKVSELEMKSLRSQMNPHFMFNSLNSINNFIVKNDQENASDYLTNFAQLMRIILENSRQDWVTLESELKALRLYIDMEKLRFENLFFYHESISEDLNLMTTLIPPMLIQPYIENAIWHGLLPKKSDHCNLKLSLDVKGEYIIITIEDDGIGTKVSQRNKSSFNISKKSFGMKIIAERLDMINEIYKLDAKVQMQDKSDISDNETGTKVILSMKIKMIEK